MTKEEKEKVRAAKREYARKWREKNKDKVRAAQERYWLKRVQREQEQREKQA